MEITPHKVAEFMDYSAKNLDARRDDCYASGFGCILRLLSTDDPECARQWYCRFVEDLEEPRRRPHSLSAFMNRLIDAKSQEFSPKRNIPVDDSTENE